MRFFEPRGPKTAKARFYHWVIAQETKQPPIALKTPFLTGRRKASQIIMNFEL